MKFILYDKTSIQFQDIPGFQTLMHSRFLTIW